MTPESPSAGMKLGLKWMAHESIDALSRERRERAETPERAPEGRPV